MSNIVYMYTFLIAIFVLTFWPDYLVSLMKDLNLVHGDLISTGDNEVNSQVVKLLLKLGIKQLNAYDLIHNHILSVFKSDAWKVSSINFKTIALNIQFSTPNFSSLNLNNLLKVSRYYINYMLY